jgi:tRNA-splicing ligase RtcB (3'-phosphate/5'-hydroxy nucleic acid ligase)
VTELSSKETYVEESFHVPIISWLPVGEIEDGAMQQLRNAASHPEALDHIAVMPDVHQGYGIPVGSVMLTANSVIPNAVGVDIGCGVAAYNTHRRAKQRDGQRFWHRWAEQVGKDVPTGFVSHRSPQRLDHLDIALQARELQQLVNQKAAVQIGTLGGGNHFMEAAVSEEGEVWLLVHSGSRHTGLRIAGHYHDLAKRLKHVRGLNTVDDLASLAVEDVTGQDYLHDMTWAANFAMENRLRMLRAMARALGIDVHRREVIDIPHNLAWHEGETVTHRKGATPAHKDQLGIIPGSMGSASYIIRGKGVGESFESCSHGAGRAMSRSRARSKISESQFAASLEGTFSRPSISYVDEAPGAYKNIKVVLDRQKDLVDVVHRLRPIITLKGDSRARED